MWQFTKRIGRPKQSIADFILGPMYRAQWTPWSERFRIMPVKDINDRYRVGRVWTRSRIVHMDAYIVTETEWVKHEFDMIRAEERDRQRREARGRYGMNWVR